MTQIAIKRILGLSAALATGLLGAVSPAISEEGASEPDTRTFYARPTARPNGTWLIGGPDTGYRIVQAEPAPSAILEAAKSAQSKRSKVILTIDCAALELESPCTQEALDALEQGTAPKRKTIYREMPIVLGEEGEEGPVTALKGLIIEGQKSGSGSEARWWTEWRGLRLNWTYAGAVHPGDVSSNDRGTLAKGYEAMAGEIRRNRSAQPAPEDKGDPLLDSSEAGYPDDRFVLAYARSWCTTDKIVKGETFSKDLCLGIQVDARKDIGWNKAGRETIVLGAPEAGARTFRAADTLADRTTDAEDWLDRAADAGARLSPPRMLMLDDQADPSRLRESIQGVAPAPSAMSPEPPPLPRNQYKFKGGTRLACFTVRRLDGVQFRDFSMRDCWPFGVNLFRTRNVLIENLLILGSSDAIIAKRDANLTVRNNVWISDWDNAVKERTAAEKLTEACLEVEGRMFCPGAVWHSAPWWISHDAEWIFLNGALLQGRDLGPNIHFSGNTLFGAYNGIRIKGYDINNRPGASEAQVHVYDNVFLHIRDNPVEIEKQNGPWVVAGNLLYNSHALFSMDGAETPWVVIFGNVSGYDAKPGLACEPDRQQQAASRAGERTPRSWHKTGGLEVPPGFPQTSGFHKQARLFDYDKNRWQFAGDDSEDEKYKVPGSFKKGAQNPVYDHYCATHARMNVMKAGAKGGRNPDGVLVAYNSFQTRGPLIQSPGKGHPLPPIWFINNAVETNGLITIRPDDRRPAELNKIMVGTDLNDCKGETAPNRPEVFWATGPRECNGKAGKLDCSYGKAPAWGGIDASVRQPEAGEGLLLDCAIPSNGNGTFQGMIRDHVMNGQISARLAMSLSGRRPSADGGRVDPGVFQVGPDDAIVFPGIHEITADGGNGRAKLFEKPKPAAAWDLPDAFAGFSPTDELAGRGSDSPFAKGCDFNLSKSVLTNGLDSDCTGNSIRIGAVDKDGKPFQGWPGCGFATDSQGQRTLSCRIDWDE